MNENMILPIIYPSAIEYWMNSDNLKEIGKYTLQNRKLITLPDEYGFCPTTNLVIWVSTNLGLKYPITLMAPSSKARRNSNLYKCKIKTKSFPENSFVRVARLTGDNDSNKAKLRENMLQEHLPQMDVAHICVASPELCFLQAASQLPFLDLLKLGYDLCARYIISKQALFMQVNREPLTNATSIVRFLDVCENVTGIKAARSVANYIVDNSNSPMETKLCIIMILPVHLGGYGITKPELNKYIRLSADAAALYGAEMICCDLVWKALKIIVEYDSNETHLSKEQHARDKARSTALQMSGYKVISLTADSLRPEKIDETMCKLKKTLGQRVRMMEMGKYKALRENTISYLFKEM